MQSTDKNIFTIRYIARGKTWFFPLLLFLCLSLSAFAQEKEIGFGLGGLSYTGDLQPKYSLTKQSLSGEAFYIRNYPNGWSAKVRLLMGSLKGGDNPSADALATKRNSSFSTFMGELSIAAQYHFLDFKSDNDLVRFSPYLTAGAGLFTFNRTAKNANYSTVQVSIPFGGGIKYRLSPNWTLGSEFTAHKTFFDYLDNISEENVTTQSNSSFQFGNWKDNDWFYYLGVSISYTFYNVNCPVQFKKKLLQSAE